MKLTNLLTGAAFAVALGLVAPVVGSYTLQLGVENVVDNNLPSGAVLDNLSVSGIPEPATWAMMLLGVGLIGRGLRMARCKESTAFTAA